MKTRVRPIADVPIEDRAACDGLAAMVLGQHAATVRDQWAPPEWLVTVEDSDRIVCYAGFLVREGLRDGWPVKIGGICHARTHPDFRNQGVTGHVLSTAGRELIKLGVHMLLLTCAPATVPWGEKLHLVRFLGELTCACPPLVNYAVMIYPGPPTGTIDLRGQAW
jgi:GNAT superfamily N-acetyltransferase